MAATARAVDLTNVKEGGNFRPKRRPEGDYKAKIVKADDHQPKDASKAAGWVLTVQVEGDARSTYPYYLSPETKQAWKIGQICRAAGLNVKNARIKFDPNKLVNKSIGIALADDEYEGKVKSSIDDVFPVSEVQANADEDGIDEDEPIEDDEPDLDIPDDEEIEEEDEPEPEPVKPVARKRRAAPPPPPVEDEDDEEDDIEVEETPPVPTKRRVVRKPAPVVEDPEDDDEEEEEPAPAPKTRRVVRRPKPAPVVEDDELDDLDLDDLD